MFGRDRDSVGSADSASARSGDSDFDNDSELASPYTWLGRRVNALVRTYRDVEDDELEAAGSALLAQQRHDVTKATSENGLPPQKPAVPKISSGYAIVFPKADRQRLKFRRKFIISLTWALLALNLLLIGGMTGIFLIVKYRSPLTFGLRMLLMPLHMNLSYDTKGPCGDPHFIEKIKEMNGGCNLRFFKEIFCRVELGVSLLQLFFCIPVFILYGLVAIIFLLRKKSRLYLTTVIGGLSSLIVYVSIFYLFHTVFMYRRAREHLTFVMNQEMDGGGNGTKLTKWWDNTQKHGKCCGVQKPGNWLGKIFNPMTNMPYTDRYPLSCCDPTKSSCTQLPFVTEIYNKGCFDGEQAFINLYTILVILILIIGAFTSPFMKFLFYFIGRISKHYIGRKSVHLQSKYARCEAYGEMELVAYKLSSAKSELVFYGRELLKGDLMKGRVNRKRIFKLVIRRKRKRVARIMIRSGTCISEKDKRKATPVVYKVAADMELGIIAIIF